MHAPGPGLDFNPHEREARDAVHHLQQVQLRDFNPHEREARDISIATPSSEVPILIHTSVKLVTTLAMKPPELR